MKLLSILIALLVAAQAYAGAWPETGGTGAGSGDGLSLSRAIVQYNTDLEDEVIAITYTDSSVVEVENLGANWALSGDTVGWTGATAGAARGRLVRAAGTATTEVMVLVSGCWFDIGTSDNNDLLYTVLLSNSVEVPNSRFYMGVNGNSKPSCFELMYFGEVAALQEFTVGLIGATGIGGMIALDHVSFLAWAPSYTPPDIDAEGTGTLTADQLAGGVITNRGASAPVTYTLPVAVAGMSVTIINEAAFAIVINPDGTDRITNLTNTAGDGITSDGVVTSALTLISSAANEWWGMPVGSWPDTN